MATTVAVNPGAPCYNACRAGGRPPALFAYLSRAVEMCMREMGTGPRMLVVYLWVVAGVFTLGSLVALFSGEPWLALGSLVLAALNAGAAFAITR